MNEQVKSKADLLQQLKIDEQDRKNSDNSGGLGALPVLLIGLLCLAAGFGLASWGPSWMSKPEVASVSKGQSVQAERPTTQVAPEPVQNSKPSVKTTQQSASNTSKSAQQTILNGSGYVTARRKATVSSELMGLITEVNVEEGMQVEAGQILARLDDAAAQVNFRLAKARVEVLNAQHESAVASLKEAESNHQRVLNNEFSSQADTTRVVAELARQQANLAGIKANLQVAQLEVERQQELLDDFVIRAPFSGIVTVKNAQPGEIVSPASAGGGFTRTGICTIVDMNSLEIEVDVNEAYIGRVSPGQRVIATLDAYPNWEIPATVIAIIPTADRAKATVKTRIGLDANDSRILPDMGIKVAFLEN